MCSKTNPAFENGGERVQLTTRSGVSSAMQFTPPVYRQTKNCDFVEFYAYDPELGKMRRKRIKTNRIHGVTKRKNYVRDLIKRLEDQLRHGWNPWIAGDASNLVTIGDALDTYEAHVEKMFHSDYFRKDTYSGYKSYLKILRGYIEKRRPIYYVYQFDRKFCADFLDYVFIDRNNGAQTRNNYLNFLRVLSGFFVEKSYLKSRATDGINPISKRLFNKVRTEIPHEKVAEIADYCKKNDPYFLLVCYILYYCFIRPVEMTRLRIRDFNLKAGTVTLSCEISKNRETQTITLPKKVLLYAVELGVFSSVSGNYLFSENLRPGPEPTTTKILRDHWEKLRKALKFKKEWKLYSLKDTGITEMLDDKIAPKKVRDQARHSSLAITELYTSHAQSAEPAIFDVDGSL